MDHPPTPNKSEPPTIEPETYQERTARETQYPATLLALRMLGLFIEQKNPTAEQIANFQNHIGPVIHDVILKGLNRPAGPPTWFIGKAVVWGLVAGILIGVIFS